MGGYQLVSHWTLGVSIAIELGLGVAREALEKGISGYVVVYDRHGMPLYCQAVGDKYSQAVVTVAHAKARTVLNWKVSTSKRRESMEANGRKREDYAGTVETLFSGGVALFHKKELIGAVAFSGGTQEEDEEVCLKAARKLNIDTDLD